MGFDIYAEITDRIIAELEKGSIPWKKPWVGSQDCAISHTTLKPYSILNQLLLGGKVGEFITLKQANREGGTVRKGEKSSFVTFWKMLETEDKDTGEEKTIPYLRYYRVFHISQCEGIKPRFKQEPLPNVVQPHEEAERILWDYCNREGIRVDQALGNRCSYSPELDRISLPAHEQFFSLEEAVSSFAHECGHSVGHPSRLNRHLDSNFGSESYSLEELVAEITACAITHHVGLETPESFTNSAAYIQSWLRALKNDKKLIVIAAGKAEKAYHYILGDEAEEPQDMGE